MKYFKSTNSEGYIDAISTGYGETEITEEEYNIILNVINSKPVEDSQTKLYRLKSDLTWEETDMIILDTDTTTTISMETLLQKISDLETKIQNYTFELKQLYDNVQEVIKIKDDEMPTGDYLNPIHWTQGMYVEVGKFYYETDYDMRYECIKDGIPTWCEDNGLFNIEYFTL